MPDSKHPGLGMIGEEINKNAKKGNGVEWKDSGKKNPARGCWVTPAPAHSRPQGTPALFPQPQTRPLPRPGPTPSRPRPPRALPTPTQAGAALAAADDRQHHRLCVAAGTAQVLDPHRVLGGPGGSYSRRAAFAGTAPGRAGAAELGRGQA